MDTVAFLGTHFTAREGDGYTEVLLEDTCVPCCVFSGRRYDDGATPRRNGRGDGIRQARAHPGTQCGHDRTRRFSGCKALKQCLPSSISCPTLRNSRSLDGWPRRLVRLDNGLFTARVSGWDCERENLRRRRKKTRCDATRGLIQRGREHRDRRDDGFYLRGLVEHLTARTLNDPAVHARTGKPHSNCTADLSLIDQLVRNDVVERPIHVRQIDVNEHASDLRGA